MCAKSLAVTAAVIASLSAVTPAVAQSITNGGFEAGNLSGWTAANGPQVWSGYTPYGNYFLWLGGRDVQNTSVYQVVSGLTVGQTYSLNFAIASEYVTQDTLRASVDGVGSIFTAPVANGCCWNNWVTQSLTFTALTTSATVQFDTIGISSFNRYDIGVDNVSLTAVAGVPEPGTWAMMLLGFGGIGFAMRRRREAQPLAQVA